MDSTRHKDTALGDHREKLSYIARSRTGGLTTKLAANSGLSTVAPGGPPKTMSSTQVPVGVICELTTQQAHKHTCTSQVSIHGNARGWETRAAIPPPAVTETYDSKGDNMPRTAVVTVGQLRVGRRVKVAIRVDGHGRRKAAEQRRCPTCAKNRGEIVTPEGAQV